MHSQQRARVYRELRRIRSAGEVDEGLAWTVDFLAREFSAMRGEEAKGGALTRSPTQQHART